MGNSRQDLQILRRGFRRRCPQCGEAPIFARWGELRRTCAHCELPLLSREGDTWAFMYFSTAFITGLFVLVMLWIHPTHHWIGRIIIAGGALLAFLLTHPTRKSIAIACDYWIELRLSHKSGLKFRPNSQEQKKGHAKFPS